MDAVSSFKTWFMAAQPTSAQLLITSTAMVLLLVLTVGGLEWNSLRRARILNTLELVITGDRLKLEKLSARLESEEDAITKSLVLMEEIHVFLLKMQREDINRRLDAERAVVSPRPPPPHLPPRKKHP